RRSSDLLCAVMPVRMDARKQGARYPCTEFIQLIMGQAKTENRWRQADHGERILGHTSSSGTGVASTAANDRRSIRYPMWDHPQRGCTVISCSHRLTSVYAT